MQQFTKNLFLAIALIASIHLTQYVVHSKCQRTLRTGNGETQQNHQQKSQNTKEALIDLRKNIHRKGIPYLRTMYEPGALEFMRERYAEPWWNATKYSLPTMEIVQDKRGRKRMIKKHYEFYVYEKSNKNERNLDLYTLEMLDQVYKNRVIQSFIHTYDDPKDRLRTVDPSLVSKRKCHAHLDYLVKQADRWSLYAKTGDVKYGSDLDPEVAAFFDSYASDDSGSLLGNFFFAGSAHECKERMIIDMRPFDATGPTRFNGRYCIASMKSANWTNLIKEKQKDLEKSHHWKVPDQAEQYWKSLSLQVGFCLPDTCDTTILNERKDDLKKLATLKLNYPYRSYHLEDLWCIPDSGSEHQRIDSSGWKVIYGACIWLTICFWAAISDNESLAGKKPAELTIKDKLIMCFSISRNWRSLTESGPEKKHPVQQAPVASMLPKQNDVQPIAPPHAKDLSFLDLFKVVSLVLIMFGHICTFIFQFTRNGLQQHEIGPEWYNFFYNAVTYCCDYFFAITGIITSYVVFSRGVVLKFNTLQWIHMIIHRWFRLAPMFILVTWFSKNLLRHMGDGPFWDYGTTSITLRKRCMEESYIYSTLLVSNLHPIHQECIVPAWYVSNDMQNYLFSPFILIGLAKFPRSTWTLCILAILGCLYARYYFYMTDPRVRHIDLMRVRRDCYVRNNYDAPPTYLYSYYRFPSYLIGLLGGHYVYMVRSGLWNSSIFKLNPKEKLSTFGRYFRRFLSIASLSMSIIIWVNLKIMDILAQSVRDPDDIKGFISRGYGVHFANAALWMTIFLVTLMLGEFENFRKFCEKPIWRLISKFNYFVMLIHMEIFYFYHLNTDHLEIQSARQAWTEIVMVILMSYLSSLVLTTIFETPMAQLESTFVAPLFHGRKQNKAAGLHKDDGKTSDDTKSKKPEIDATTDTVRHIRDKKIKSS